MTVKTKKKRKKRKSPPILLTVVVLEDDYLAATRVLMILIILMIVLVRIVKKTTHQMKTAMMLWNHAQRKLVASPINFTGSLVHNKQFLLLILLHNFQIVSLNGHL